MEKEQMSWTLGSRAAIIFYILSWLTKAAMWAWPWGWWMGLNRKKEVKEKFEAGNSSRFLISDRWKYCFLLSHSDVKVSCHLVDVGVSVYPAGVKWLHWSILSAHSYWTLILYQQCISANVFFFLHMWNWPWWQSSGASFKESLVQDFLQSMFLSQPALYDSQRPEGKEIMRQWGNVMNQISDLTV